VCRLTVLNSYIILSPCGSQIDHRIFCLVWVENLLEMISRDVMEVTEMLQQCH
jgi:hypothetical protein